MNVTQMRIAVRDILTAGGGVNTAINTDEFWTDSEIITNLNRAQDEIYKVIRRARADYFTRILRTTDAPFRVRGQDFNPASLRWSAGNGNYAMPLDFVRMKLITDLSTSRVRVSASDLSKNEFRILMNAGGSGQASEYLYDILGQRTMVIRPFPSDERDFEFIYEKNLPPMRELNRTDTMYAIGETTTGTFASQVTRLFNVGDEIMVNTTKPDPTTVYGTIKTIDSLTQVTMEGIWSDPNTDLAGNGAPTPYMVASVSEIPVHHHQLLICLAASYCFKKGMNPSLDAAAAWREEYDSMLPSLINEVESRQGSDIESSEPYLADDYD